MHKQRNQGYDCTCNYGFKRVSDWEAGVVRCLDVEECNECPNGITCEHAVCTGPHETCINTLASYRCECMLGFEDDTTVESLTCLDTDECENSPCSSTSEVCVNSAGSFSCDCLPGFGIGISGPPCVDINECEQMPCSLASGTCENEIGTFRCQCFSGYSNEEPSEDCIDINECDTWNPCVPTSETCVNEPGTYDCECATGFTRSEESGPESECLDINECDLKPCENEHFPCLNQPGNFVCSECPADRIAHTLTGECVERNDCTIGGALCDGFCMVVGDSFICGMYFQLRFLD